MNFSKYKYIHVIFSICFIFFLIWLLFDYQELVHSDNLPSGRAAKGMTALMLVLDKIGGKPFTISVLTVLIAPYIYSTIKNLIKDISIVEEDIKKLILTKGDKFWLDDYEIHITDITSTPEGYNGKGWVEIGIINKTKQEVEFKNIDVNEEYVAIKGNIDFL